MFILMVVIFILGYTMIALEHPLNLDKAASALLTGTILWGLYALSATGILELGYSPGWDIVRIQDEVSELFGGRSVDLVPFKYINRHIRKRVLSEAQVLYETA